MKHDLYSLSLLNKRLEQATKPDIRLWKDMLWELDYVPNESPRVRTSKGERQYFIDPGPGGYGEWRGCDPYFFGTIDGTYSLDAAIAFAARVLPGASEGELRPTGSIVTLLADALANVAEKAEYNNQDCDGIPEAILNAFATRYRHSNECLAAYRAGTLLREAYFRPRGHVLN